MEAFGKRTDADKNKTDNDEKEIKNPANSTIRVIVGRKNRANSFIMMRFVSCLKQQEFVGNSIADLSIPKLVGMMENALEEKAVPTYISV